MRELPAPVLIRSKISCGGSPALMPKNHGLGARHVVDGDQKVGDVFHPAAVAEGADVVHRAGEPREHGFKLLDLAGVARSIDHEILDLGLGAGAAHRAIEHDVPGLAQLGFGGGLVFKREGRGFDDDAARHLGLDDGLDRRGQRLRARQAGDDGFRLARHFAGVASNLDTRAPHGAAPLGRNIETDHTPAGGHEILRK